MQICYLIRDLRDTLKPFRQQGKTIAVVPTMGNLHAGHIKLVTTARAIADIVVATIFVNPMQFGQSEDLDKYPRTPDADIEKLTAAGCDYLFTPPVSEIYPRGLNNHTLVHTPDIVERHCGASRPGHFDGVATVVSKLFNIVQPDHAVFGLKDYQQFQVIRKMVEDLCFDITLTGVSTEREQSGLALSSRNSYLSEAEKTQALALGQVLRQTAGEIHSGQRDYRALESDALQALLESGLKPDYFAICTQDDLQPAAPGAVADRPLVILAAAFAGSTRLIDNIEVDTNNKQ
ncbi:MAG: pantoate--beta-alanine ligase [Pseudohongiella sp.]|nr:pantoate--beta-alanine ligase [Pseudohongiella sp.]|tara:strand:- start:354 stop:1223 length:870 start_codon:yes stop_codon:yes gene_type:complete